MTLNTLLPQIKQQSKGKPKDHTKDEFIQGKPADKKQLIAQYECHEVDIYDDYMELVIEFGFLTLFAESFILAPIAILLLNRMEKFSDLYKFKYNTRRPEFIRKRNIGMWGNILLVQSIIAIFTNLSLTLMLTNDNPQIEYVRNMFRSKNKLSFRLSFFLVEHGIIIILILVWLFISSVSPWVDLFLKRRDYNLKSNKWKVLIEGMENEKKKEN
jgi:anoctamin-10